MKRSDATLTDRFAQLVLLSLAFMLIIITAAQFAQAQVLYGSLVGRVEDPSGAILPGASITVLST